jgi:hypothetical protein
MIVRQRFLDLVKCALLAGRQAHHAVLPGGTRCPASCPAHVALSRPSPRLPCRGNARGPGGGVVVPVVRGAPLGWFRPRCPPAWPQERRTGSSRGRRKDHRPPSPLRPAAPPGPLPPRWERTARGPHADRRRATSSSGSALRTLQAAPQPACPPARAPASAGRGSARRNTTWVMAEHLQHLGHVRASGSTLNPPPGSGAVQQCNHKTDPDEPTIPRLPFQGNGTSGVRSKRSTSSRRRPRASSANRGMRRLPA